MSGSVYVLLATFNGARYLREQVDSILAQSGVEVQVLARDDGSSDDTPALLDEYVQRFPGRFTLLPAGAPTGSPQANFLLLIQAALAFPEAQYLAFADQDDVWLPEKLATEMEAMLAMERKHGADRPLLVFSDLTVVDADLRPLHPSMWNNLGINAQIIGRMQRIAVQNVVTGCTMLINRAMAQAAARMPLDAQMHDWWIALLASAFGSATPLTLSTVLYRQHRDNVVGAVLERPATGVPRWRDHRKRRAGWEQGVHQAEAFLRVHGAELSSARRRSLERLRRCDRHPSRWMRVGSWLRGGFFLSTGLRANLAVLWYLWDRNAATTAATEDAL